MLSSETSIKSANPNINEYYLENFLDMCDVDHFDNVLKLPDPDIHGQNCCKMQYIAVKVD